MDLSDSRTDDVGPRFADVPVLRTESYGRLFLRFLRLGANAWGGPPAQIAMLREEMVEREKWVTSERFNRTLAVYQVLPGPEATEMCCHMGMVARGRPGAVVAGLGFVLPGLALMLLLSWMYVQFGLNSAAAAALVAGFAPAVAALVLRAVHTLGRHALRGRDLVILGVAGAAVTFLGVRFYWVIPIAGLLAFAWRSRIALLRAAAMIVLVTGLVAAAWWSPGVQTALVEESRTAGPDPSHAEIAWSGLKAGLLTFGGAYTAIPFLQEDAVGPDGWVTTAEFVDGIALSGILPAPLIIFSTFLGYLGGGLAGALVMTAAIFLPAFAFTLIGYTWFERLVTNERLHAFLDGVTAAVIGIIAVTAVGLVLAAVQDALTAGLLLVALTVLVHWPSRAAVPLTVLGCALAYWLLS